MNFCSDTISIRLAIPDDAPALLALAALDSAVLPAPPLLLAERGGQLQAALAVRDGTAVADPFAPTVELVQLLRVRAERLRPADDLAGRLRARFSDRRSRRAYAA